MRPITAALISCLTALAEGSAEAQLRGHGGPIRALAVAAALSGSSAEPSPATADSCLDEQRRQLQARLATPLTDHEVADLSNDLAFIGAICSELAHSMKSS